MVGRQLEPALIDRTMSDHGKDKLHWDDRDLSVMSFHDATLWSMVANTDAFEFLFDLDYLFEWVSPGEGETHFKFWVAPVTLLFENVYDVKLRIDSSQGAIEIAGLHREAPGPTRNGAFTEYTYRFECQEGEISLRATGFQMFVRRSPELHRSQRLGLEERGGIGFQRPPPSEAQPPPR